MSKKSTKDILGILSSVKPEVKVRYKAEIKGLFGSYASGGTTGESDIDVLVRFEDSADLFDLVGLGLFLQERLHCSVDVVPQDDIRPELRESILKGTIHV